MDIKKYLNYEAASFCYPYGAYNNFSIKTLKNNNYLIAVTEIQGLAFSTQNHFDRYPI